MKNTPSKRGTMVSVWSFNFCPVISLASLLVTPPPSAAENSSSPEPVFFFRACEPSSKLLWLVTFVSLTHAYMSIRYRSRGAWPVAASIVLGPVNSAAQMG
ncbi:hypothetical protein BRADI_5g27061v3 [Brachypodium distachyon]|uniref:Uncharacterized protein n=1 Tax=Brachypodium distachyon TaxID=15368 RepID=A0A0Q3KZE3_BRADI|nr:hypothetical protein BRADI_5g27061v3 [Brachypodium distachyon]